MAATFVVAFCFVRMSLTSCVFMRTSMSQTTVVLSCGVSGALPSSRQAQIGAWKKGDGSFHSFEMFAFSDFELYEVKHISCFSVMLLMLLILLV